MTDSKRQKSSHQIDWQVVEYNAIKHSHVWSNDSDWNGILYNECSYEQIVHAGLSTIQRSRINRNEWKTLRVSGERSSLCSTMTAFDGLLQYKGTDIYKAVQVKHHQRPISANDLGSFYQGCRAIAVNKSDAPKPILVTTSGTTPFVMEAAHSSMFNFEVVNLDVNLFKKVETAEMEIENPKFQLRECQIQCLQKIEQADSEYPFVVGLPPGCGKTQVAMHWSEHFSTVIIAAPTKNLVKELHDRVLQHYGNTAECIVFDSDTFTDSAMLSQKKADNKQIIVTTYASSEKAASVFADTENLGVIIDEAHNMNAFTDTLFNLTENPLLLSGTYEGIDDEVLEMIPDSNKYIMSMEDAEKQGHILPLRWIIPSGIDSAITDMTESAEFLMTVMMRKGLNSCAAFFGRVEEAEQFAKAIPTIGLSHSKTATCMTITSATSQTERDRIKQWVQNGDASEIRILASVRTCNEGVDLPALQSVYIPTSGCDITNIQRICRANRVDGVKTEAVVILNTGGSDMTSISSMMVGRSVNITAVTPCIENTNLETEKVTVSKAEASVRQGVTGFQEWRYQYQIDICKQYREKSIRITQKTVYTDADGNPWNIGMFVKTQRAAHNKGKLSSVREQQCRDVGILTEEIKIKQLFKKAHEEHGKSYIANLQQNAIYQGQTIGIKCNSLRKRYRTNLMSSDDVQFYERLGMVWDYQEYSWKTHFQYWKDAKESGTLKRGAKIFCTELQKDTDIYRWQYQQRQDRKTAKVCMTEDRIAKLNAADFKWYIF